jgi:DNA-binding beta-propeller fold protein YncE
MIRLLFLLASTAFAQGTLFIGTWPHTIHVVDEAKQQEIDKIELTTGLPSGMQLSEDRKTLYVNTLEKNGMEVVDVATRKVTNSFTLNEPAKQFRIRGGAVDPQGKFMYILFRTIEKKQDRFDIGKETKFGVIDLAQKKMVRTGDVPKDEDQPGFGFGGQMRFSPDGKFLYVFRNNVFIFDTADFKVVDKIELAKPQIPGMQNIGIGGSLDSIQQPGTLTSLFNSQDPVVHRNIFGIARFDLTGRTFDFTPIGPTTGGTLGLHVTPDRKKGYTVAFNGQGGTRRCEFWEFDLTTNQLVRKQEFDGRARFSFGISSTGKELYIFGAGYTIEVYDAATMRIKNTIDLNADITSGMIVVPASPRLDH